MPPAAHEASLWGPSDTGRPHQQALDIPDGNDGDSFPSLPIQARYTPDDRPLTALRS